MYLSKDKKNRDQRKRLKGIGVALCIFSFMVFFLKLFFISNRNLPLARVAGATSTLAGDVDQDGDVDFTDYVLLLEQFGVSNDCENGANFDTDCAVTIFDFNILITHFGETQPLPSPSSTPLPGTEVTSISTITAVPTFESIGLSLSYTGDSNQNSKAQVQYKISGTTQWKNGLDLFVDRVAPDENEYRGSLVHLEPNTTYDVKVTVVDPDGVSVSQPPIAQVTTWSENFPIVDTIEVTNRTTTLVINEGGSPISGYVLYKPAPGSTGLIDVSGSDGLGSHDYGIDVQASYVIIRGLTVIGAKNHGIYLRDVHDVVIEENDISGWGSWAADGWGEQHDAAVYSSNNNDNLERITIQRNKIHDPRTDSNSWREPRPDSGQQNINHPHGPQAVSIFNPKGDLVIRYNTIWTDGDHMFNDIIGGGTNKSFEGFPGNNSDIYGNYLEGNWDNAIEADGGNENVRIWSNYMTNINEPISIQPLSVGPMYIWRNISAKSRHSAVDNNPDSYGRCRLFKLGNKKSESGGPDFGHGGVYIFHNTILQPPNPSGGNRTLGCSDGLDPGIPDQGHDVTYTMTRNNILHVMSGSGLSIATNNTSTTNDFNYDLYNGQIIAYTSPLPEPEGIVGIPTYINTPIFEFDPVPGNYTLRTNFTLAENTTNPEKDGVDDGALIPNFNDSFTGIAPDMGAHEAGTPLMEFGVDAYR